jgi:hypothetical protein
MTRYTYLAITTAVLVMSLCLSGFFYGLGTKNLAAYAQAPTTNNESGLIGSIQNNQQGHRAWIITGVWVMKFGNVSNIANSNVSSQYSHVSDFNASLTMVMLNGTASHNHQISNFTQTGRPTLNHTANSTTIHGNVTVTMREGPVHKVPIRITIFQGKAIAIWLDPSKTNKHFGDTRIYGTVGVPKAVSEELAKLISNVTMGNESKMMMMTQGSQNTNNSGMVTNSNMSPPAYQ